MCLFLESKAARYCILVREVFDWLKTGVKLGVDKMNLNKARGRGIAMGRSRGPERTDTGPLLTRSSCAVPLLIALVILAWSSQLGRCATFVVTSVADSGPGTLRQALLDANANFEPDVIEFRISGSPPFTIIPRSPLPGIYEPLVVDGTTQPGYNGSPIIELNGEQAGSEANGLRILSSNCVVRGLVINRFARDGIRIEGLGGNIVEGNYVGTDVSGKVALGNGWGGVSLYSALNRVGGPGAGKGNLLSGNKSCGLYIQSAFAVSNVVCGNRIGTDKTGLIRVPNQTNGIVIAGAVGNVIGGTNTGEGNVISGNGLSGIYLLDGADGNVIQGNLIGLGSDGVTVVSNSFEGVVILGSSQNKIGGTALGARNVISGNGGRGILIYGTGAVSNVVEGNLIGTDITGRTRAGNRFSGVEIQSGPGNRVGGSVNGARNIIAGNGQAGVMISGLEACGNEVRGNLIGTDESGTIALGNAVGGVYVRGSENVVSGNVVSGNQMFGVYVATGQSSSNIVTGNLIGLDITGQSGIGNSGVGVQIDGTLNRVGGATPQERNVISANKVHGIVITGSGARQNIVQGNYIGTDITGTKGLGNENAGILVDASSFNQIGGRMPGQGNLISGNVNSGIILYQTRSMSNVVQGNWVGLDASGKSALPNMFGGIYIYEAGSNIIGGVTPGAGNIISGNYKVGISVGDPGSEGNVIQGNWIGLAADGVTPVGNEWHGIEFLNSAKNNLVGGLEPEAANTIAYARTEGYDGVRVRETCTGIAVLSNAVFGNGGASASGLGIDLGADGLTANDNCDADTGANNQQNFPALRAFAWQGGTVVVGTLNSVPNRSYQVQLFANAFAEASGHGEGEQYLATISVSTASNCNGSFTCVVPQSVPTGHFITATATDSAGNTSEFSAMAKVEPLPCLESGLDLSKGTIQLRWKPVGEKWSLEMTRSLTQPIVWVPVDIVPRQFAGTNIVELPLGEGNAFYRLMFSL